MMTTQLRRYEIEPGQLDDFVRWFGALIPARAGYGLSLDWAYADHESNQFVWSTSYDGTVEEFKEIEATYNASLERKAAYGDYKPPVTAHHVSFVEVLEFG